MKFKLYIFALFVLLVANCTREPISQLEEQGGKLVTISATIPPETRVEYTDSDVPGSGGTLTWQSGDKLLLAGYDGTTYIGSSTFTYVSGSGSNFSGTTVPGATTYKAYYLAEGITLDETTGDVQLADNFWQQTQSGNATTGHLRNNILLFDEEANSLTETFTLVLKSSIIRLNLTGIPEDAGELHHLIYTVETATGVFKSVSIGVTEVTFSPTVSSITAYLAFDPTEVTKVISGGKVIISLYAEKSYMWKIDAVTQEKSYVAGQRYKGAVSSGWTEIINPLSYVARYNVNPAGTGFVGDLTSCEGSGYFNWNQATAISFAGYHLPSRKEWRSIVPEAYGYVCFKTKVDKNNITEYVTVGNQDITMTCDYRSVGTASNPTPSYALRYKGTDMLSAWKYEYIYIDNGDLTYNTHLKVTCCNVVPSVTINDVANPGAWFIGNNVVRYFPACGMETSYGEYDNLGKVGYYWSSTYDTNSKAYIMYFTSGVAQMYIYRTSNKYPVRLFYNAH